MDRAKKKFANALDGLRSLGNRNEMSIEVEERLQPEHCVLRTVVRHGFPDDAKCLAYDPVQRLVAIGTGRGCVRVLGETGVDYQMVHPTDHPVTNIIFCINEGALVTACSNDMVHLWNFRQKHPEILHSLQMSKEGITAMHLPYGGRWLMLGTEKGNVYFVCVSSFQLSTVVINWNKAIDIACRVHPGCVRQISTCPTDHSKIGIVFEKGVVALWDIVSKTAERLPMDPPVKCLSWHYTGQSLMTGNVDGSICIYNAKKWTEVAQKSTPHGTGSCRPIHQVEWRHANETDQFLVFSGGMPSDDNLPIPAITVLRGAKSATVMEMEQPIVTFVTLNSIPLENVPQQPHGIAVLLKNSFMLIDLLAPQFAPREGNRGVSAWITAQMSTTTQWIIDPQLIITRLKEFPTIECPHSLDIHESPVTTVAYYSDCPSDLMGALTLVGCKQRKKGLSDRKWPINGGIGRDCATGHQELVLTGHKDGSIRFWAASGEDLQILYRLKAASHFERLEETEGLRDVSHAIKTLELCVDSRLLLVTGISGQVTLFRFVKQEGVNVIAVVSIPVLSPPPPPTASTSSGIGSSIEEKPREMRRQHKLLSESSRRQSSETSDEGDERIVPFKIRGGAVKRPPGYQPELSCLVPWRSSSSSDSITSTALNSAFGVLAIGTASGLALVDITQCALIYAWSSAELYGSDPTPAVQLGSLSMGDSSPIEMPYGASLEADEVGEDVAVSMPPTSPKWGTEGAPHGTPPTVPEEPLTRPAGRSHSMKGSSGIMRRLTNKGHSIARSFSLHVKENGEGDTSPRQGGVPPVGSGGDRGGMNGSPSTSCASLERSGRGISEVSTSAEGVTSLSFMHTYTKRGDKSSTASLWVGTSGGACIALNLLLPPDRITSSVVVSPSGTTNGDPPPSSTTGTRFVKAYSLGTVIRARGACIAALWMDSSFCIIEPPFEKYRENNAQASPDRCSTNKVITKESLSPAYTQQQETVSPDELAQVVVIISEWEIRVVALPSFALLFVHKCQDIPFVKARSTHIRGHPCLMSITAAGQIAVFSLPSLRPLHTSQLLPRSIDIDDPACQRMSLSEHGLGIYMASPSELEKYTVCAELAEQASESMGELFVPTEVADPNGSVNGGNGGGAGSFLKGIFSGGGSTPRGVAPADLDAILADKPGPSGTSGSVAMRTVGRTIPGPARMDRAAAGSVTAGQAAAMALQNLNERSEKLNATVDATENLKNSAMNMASRSAKLVEKMEKKKWYNF